MFTLLVWLFGALLIGFEMARHVPAALIVSLLLMVLGLVWMFGGAAILSRKFAPRARGGASLKEWQEAARKAAERAKSDSQAARSPREELLDAQTNDLLRKSTSHAERGNT